MGSRRTRQPSAMVSRGHEHVLQVVAGHVDLFAVHLGEGTARERDITSFVVESGEIILQLPKSWRQRDK